MGDEQSTVTALTQAVRVVKAVQLARSVTAMDTDSGGLLAPSDPAQRRCTTH